MLITMHSLGSEAYPLNKTAQKRLSNGRSTFIAEIYRILLNIHQFIYPSAAVNSNLSDVPLVYLFLIQYIDSYDFF